MPHDRSLDLFSFFSLDLITLFNNRKIIKSSGRRIKNNTLEWFRKNSGLNLRVSSKKLVVIGGWPGRAGSKILLASYLEYSPSWW